MEDTLSTDIKKPENMAKDKPQINDTGTSDFVVRKTEKLVSAIYILTNFLNDLEPLKWKLRTLGTGFLSAGNRLKNNQEELGKFREMLQEIQSQLSLLRYAGLISEMNFDIINKELNNLLRSLLENEDGLSLDHEFFRINVREELKELLESRQGPSNVKDKYLSVKMDGSRESQHYLPEAETLVKRQNLQTIQEKPRQLKEFGAVAVKKSGRQSVIINLLKRKKEIMIKDVTPLISGCSEKTIQRELLVMVKQGILKKEGEKRWSRYSLA